MSKIGEAIGSVARGLVGTVVDRGLKIIDDLVPDKDLREQLQHQFRMQSMLTDADLEKAHLDADTQLDLAEHQTRQAELHQSDLYTKQTRPRIARQSWYVSGGYAVMCFVSEFVVMLIKAFADVPDGVVLAPVEFVWEVYIAAASPALTYMGVRALDKSRGVAR